MNKFKYRLTALIKILLILGILASLTCIALNVVRIANGKIVSENDWISVIIAIALSIVFTVLAGGAFIDSSYNFGDKDLIVKWGLLKNVFRYTDIDRIVLFSKTNKLVIYFTNESYFIIVIDKKDYDGFTDELLKRNKKISYEENSVE